MTQPKDNDTSIRLDDATRERISKLAIERKNGINSRQSKTDRKNAIFSAADKWRDPFAEADFMPPARTRSDAAPPTRRISMPVKKGKVKTKDEMSVSEHTWRESRDRHNDHNDNIRINENRVAKPGDGGGKLEKLLGNMNASKPSMKRDSRTVASMPVTSSQDASRQRMGSERGSRSGTSKGTHPQKHKPGERAGETKRRTASPGPMKKRSSSPGPHGERKRSSSVGPLKKKVDSASPRRSPTQSTQSSSKGSSDGTGLSAFLGVAENSRPKRSSGAGSVASAPVLRKKESSRRSRRSPSQSPRSGSKGSENGSGLDEILRLAEKSESKRSSGTEIVECAPGLRRKDSTRRSRRSAHGLVSPRRARSVDVDEPLVEEMEIESPLRRRAKSVDDVDLGVGEEALKDESSPPVKRNFSQRLSKRLNSLRNLAGLGGSNKKLNTEDGETAPKRSSRAAGRREPARSKEKPKRSSSAGPLSRPGRKDREDRRAGLSKSKRNNYALQQDEDDEEEEPQMKPPQRAQSMMLHREATRRGKSASLMDVQQYSEEEIHSTSYFASNHVLVNRERMKRGLRPLTRNIAMDQIARENAEKIAKANGVSALPATYVGNVLKGESIRAIHRSIMQNKEGRERANLLSPYFQDFGVGTAKGEDKMLYICQLFSERLELTITDTTVHT